jgi:hypothetical protein
LLQNDTPTPFHCMHFPLRTFPASFFNTFCFPLCCPIMVNGFPYWAYFDFQYVAHSLCRFLSNPYLTPSWLLTWAWWSPHREIHFDFPKPREEQILPDFPKLENTVHLALNIPYCWCFPPQEMLQAYCMLGLCFIHWYIPRTLDSIWQIINTE